MKKIFFIALISAYVLLIICCHSKKKVTDPGTKKPDFAIEVSPQTQWVTAGDSAEFQIKLISLNGFSAPCTLSMVGFPKRDSMVFDSKILVPPDSFRLTINTTFSTPSETYDLVITGKNGKLSHSNTVTLVVPSKKATDYYPLAIGNSWTYKWLDQNDQTWWTSLQEIVDTANINGNLGYIFSDGYTIVDTIYVKGDTILSKSGQIILAGPLEIGQSWSRGNFTYQVIGFEEATLKSNTTKYPNCIKLRKIIPGYPQDDVYEWWAKDVGFVKMEEYKSGQYQGSRELVSFTHP